MKKIAVVLISIFFLIGCNRNAKLKVGSFNIRTSVADDGPNNWENRRQMVVDFIRNQQFDVIGLQEVRPDQYTYLTEQLKNYSILGNTRYGQKNHGEACPILYNRDRYKLLEQETFWLSERPHIAGSKSWQTAYARIVTWAKFKDQEKDYNFYFFNTHFDHYSKKAQSNSALLLLSKIKKIVQSEPVILVGDFNCTPNSKPYNILTKKWQGVPVLRSALSISSNNDNIDRQSSFNGFDENSQPRLIDHIFVSTNIKNLKSEIHKIRNNDIFISDHYPIVSKIRIKKQRNDLGKSAKTLPIPIFSPYIEQGDRIFQDSTTISLNSYTSSADIYYTLAQSNLNKDAKLYQKPFTISESCQLFARTYKDGDSSSTVLTRNFYKSSLDTSENLSEIILNTPVSPQYYDGRLDILFDRQRGLLHKPYHGWLGFYNNDIDIVLDFGKQIKIDEIIIGFMVSPKLKSFKPQNITLLSSNNSRRYHNIYSQDLSEIEESEATSYYDHQIKLATKKTQYLRIIATNHAECPAWHADQGKPTWLFIDEIIVN